jgi:hypothetical protein
VQLILDQIKTKVVTISYTMLALRLSVFAFSCLALYGIELFLPASAVTLAAITLYAYATSKQLLLMWCRISATIIWTASIITFAVSGAPFILLLLLAIMLLLDGFLKPG